VTDGAAVGEDGVPRCPWAGGPGLMRDYHDTEWGLPVTDEQGLFERLSLEAFQAGLSWLVVLRKREHFRLVFHDFDVDAVAAMGESDVERLLTDPGIVRNRAKVVVTLANARAVQRLRESEGLVPLVQGFAPAQDPRPRTAGEVPTVSPESTALSKELKRRGFGFVGPTTMHALMEATGLVDTHLVGCHRRGIAR
jgi:DNA-3-methyladenine glycosylase I